MTLEQEAADGGKARSAKRRRGGGSPWRPTALQRSYRALLDAAKEAPQDILDTDGEMLVIGPKADVEFLRDLAIAVSELGRFQAVYAANRARPAGEWAAQTPFPWIGALDRDEVDELVNELHAYTLDAAQRGSVEQLAGLVEAWRSTAAIRGNPALMAAVTAPIDYDRLEEVFPPSEEQVKAAAA